MIIQVAKTIMNWLYFDTYNSSLLAHVSSYARMICGSTECLSKMTRSLGPNVKLAFRKQRKISNWHSFI